ncbi:MAG: aromatic acid/H+ symport family MFS transporter [Chloroflexi bacterium]|nr:aromatic acid/H+ symport family MFS transporter [Chloroflexota bacterium]
MKNTTVSGLQRGAVRTRAYLIYLIVFTGIVAIMDQYISTIKTTAIPYAIEEFGISAARFSWLEAVYLAVTFLIFLLNGLNDIIGRKYSLLVLILLMALSSLGIVLLSPTLHLFMVFYTVAMFTTVSNMWTIPVSEEAPADRRAKYVSIVYVIGLIPLQALLPPLLINTLGLDWRWMYGVMAVLAVPVLVMWLFMRETVLHDEVSRERRDGTRRRHFYGLGVIDRHDMRYIVISASIWLCWLTYSFLYYWAGYFFMTVRGYSLSQWSMVLLATLIMAILGGVLGGWLMDRLGRKPALIIGCVCLAVIQAVMGFTSGSLLPVVTAITGFFTSFTYSWIVVYVPEIFPTERRGACMGWTTTIARISYVVGPVLAAILLQAFPSMEWFWVVAGAVMLLPIGIVLLLKPYETRVMELEEIEAER